MIWRHRDLRSPISALAVCLAAAPALAADSAASDSAEPVDPQGFLYGKVETRSGSTYQGRLRWQDEEAFWGDHFDTAKKERPHLDKLPAEHRKEPFKFLGITFARDSVDDGRALAVRFGDLRKIEARRDREARLTLRTGTEIEVEGGSDVGREIKVWDPEIGEIEIPWRNVVTVEFLPTPADLDVVARRLYGSVKTTAGIFEGYLQWDRDECLTSDRLDGDSPDGEVSVEMGKIRSIEKHTRSSSKVVLKSGRELILDGSNDVDDDNRGIFVEGSRYGRVLISWNAFERVDFSDSGTSGPAYAEFGHSGPLRGKVTTRGGDVHAGRLYYDLDENETWELLDGERREIRYHIPLAMVAAVVPNGSYHSRVTLTHGEEIELQDAADVDEENDGIVVERDGGETVYVAWEEVRRIDLIHE